MIQFKQIQMTSSREEEEVVYEQQEVLWAKIRGYPWWPAFVDKVHAPVRGRESEYTVFFFGDNTQYASSKLGASKLRKFYDNYTEFYQKARAHRKLMTSIQMAEEKLKQNDQNVEIFEELRNNLKSQKKDRPKSPLHRKSSRISEPDPELSSKKEEPPELNKSKTYAHPRGRRSQAKEQQMQMQEEQSSQKQKASPAKQQAVSTRQSERTTRRQQKKQQITPSPPKRKKQPKEEIFEEPQQPKTTTLQHRQPKLLSPPQQQQVQQILEEEEEVKEQAEQSEEVEARSQSMEQEGQSEQSEDIVYEKKLRNKAHRSAQQQRVLAGHRKRGRPKKRILRHHTHHQQEKAEIGSRTQSRGTHLKRKLIHKTRPSPRKIQTSASPLSQGDSLVIEHVRRILHKREQLVEYLGSISITIHNVQEILDLGVSNILQDGQKTPKITEILFILRNVLLYKYFPEDVKHRKKYEQILRKKPIAIRNDDREKEKEREESEEQRQQQSIRKKTIVKLQKFLKTHPDVQSKARELAVKIESYFQRADREVGDTYKSLAYKVLSSLKERKESCQEVMKKLDHHAYD